MPDTLGEKIRVEFDRTYWQATVATSSGAAKSVGAIRAVLDLVAKSRTFEDGHDGAGMICDWEIEQAIARELKVFGNDDPASDPVGTFRRSPEGIIYEKLAYDERPWCITERLRPGVRAWCSNEYVFGWPVVDAPAKAEVPHA